MTDPDALLPCPFCGDRAPEITGDWAVSPTIYIACTAGSDCTATGPAHYTEAEAIAAWNTRQPPAPAATPGTDGKNGTAPANPMGQPPAPQDDLVEAVARALTNHKLKAGDSKRSQQQLVDEYWRDYIFDARAAITAFTPFIAERDAALAKLAAAEAHLRQAADNLESGAKLYNCPGLEAAAKLARAAIATEKNDE